MSWKMFHFQQMKREIDEEDAEEESEELGHAETYSEYMPSKCECHWPNPFF